MRGPDRSANANVGGWLTDRAEADPDRPAVASAGTGESLDYGQLEALCNRCASALLALGVGRGDRVALALGNEPLYLALYFAAAKLGLVFVPLNTRLTAHELGFQIEDAEARLVLSDDSVELPRECSALRLKRDALLAQLPERAAPPPLAPGGEAPQVMLYTSGTTGRPKGALLPHRKTVYNSLNAEEYFGLEPDDVVYAAVPLFHSYGLKILAVPALFCGSCIVLGDRFDPIGTQEAIARHGATVLGAVPVMYQRMLRAGLDRTRLRTVRVAFSAGAALDVETIRALHANDLSLRQGYGQTETSILCCLGEADALRKAGSVGRPVRHGEIRIVDDRGQTCVPGVSGEIVVRGPICMLEYWRRPSETRAARIDGWHRTGDLGVADEEGFLTLVGRRKELYISGGENVYPAEVERALEEHPQVAEAAVIGVPDAEWGESGRAYIVRAGDLESGELLSWARERLASYKLPRRVIWVRSLPRTESGKVKKHELAEPGRTGAGAE